MSQRKYTRWNEETRGETAHNSLSFSPEAFHSWVHLLTTLVNDLKCGSSALLMKLACLSLPRIRCQKCPPIYFTYSSIE
jgi:hypothetical protein